MRSDGGRPVRRRRRGWTRSAGRILALLLVAGGLPGASLRAGDGVVALRTADPGCPDDSGNIYVDCGNGTVTDNRTGLVWLKRSNCSAGAETAFADAVEFADSLSDTPGFPVFDCDLTDNSSPGEWRLPTIDEWEAMTADAVALGCGGAFGPLITNDSGTSCWQPGPGNSFTNVQSDFYWAIDNGPAMAYIHSLDDGTTALRLKFGVDYVWPVRRGE